MDAINQMDDYLRAIGALPPRPPADFAPAPGCNYNTGATNIDFDAHVQQFGATEVPAAPLTPASDNDADMEMEVQSPEYLNTTQGGQTDPPSSCSGCASAPSSTSSTTARSTAPSHDLRDDAGPDAVARPRAEQVQMVCIEELTE
jgi:hypothetical protein